MHPLCIPLKADILLKGSLSEQWFHWDKKIILTVSKKINRVNIRMFYLISPHLYFVQVELDWKICYRKRILIHLFSPEHDVALIPESDFYPTHCTQISTGTTSALLLVPSFWNISASSAFCSVKLSSSMLWYENKHMRMHALCSHTGLWIRPCFTSLFTRSH